MADIIAGFEGSSFYISFMYMLFLDSASMGGSSIKHTHEFDYCLELEGQF